jgi:hypothetical protein
VDVSYVLTQGLTELDAILHKERMVLIQHESLNGKPLLISILLLGDWRSVSTLTF